MSFNITKFTILTRWMKRSDFGGFTQPKQQGFNIRMVKTLEKLWNKKNSLNN